MNIEFGRNFTLSLKLPKPARPLSMIWLPPGTFLMGSPENEPGHGYEDGLPFQATLSKGFWLGQFPVTQAQWQAVRMDNPSHFQTDSENRPVESISWDDAQTFCEVLNRQFEALVPSGYQFSLPTQMQWEYACRAGTQTLYYSGDSQSALLRVAWCAANSEEQTHPVGMKEPNAWDLYDMLGNVAEWCFDAAEDNPVDFATDWVGEKYPSVRAVRGADWRVPADPSNFGVAHCAFITPTDSWPWLGFRLCLRWTNGRS